MPAAPLSRWSECGKLLLEGDPQSDFGSVGTAVLPIVTVMPVALADEARPVGLHFTTVASLAPAPRPIN